MVSEVKTIAPGATFSVALKLDHPAGWHSYYQNTGGVELPPSIKWTLPDGFTAGPIQWPAPEVKDGFFGKSFVYVGSPVFLVDITAPATLESGKTVTLTAEATWQICEESCISEKQSLHPEPARRSRPGKGSGRMPNSLPRPAPACRAKPRLEILRDFRRR